ncbi:hypothetical protein NWQ33_00435 [Mycoplasmopsis cynos]|nr:hypothetical protein [Mycoplasmopsis cynos]
MRARSTKYLASEYPHSEFEFSILGRQDIYTRIVQVPIIIDNNNYYDIHFQKQKLHFNKGKFYLQEVDASQGLGYPPTRHEYLKIRVVKKKIMIIYLLLKIKIYLWLIIQMI